MNNNQNKDNIPESYYCPITQELMVDPVIDQDGNSYEKSAIIDWLSKNPVSPLTRNPMKIEDLRPNRALKESIDLVRGHAEQKAPPSIVKKMAPKPVNFVLNPDYIRLNVVSDKEGGVLVTAKPPPGQFRTPVDICCVVDTSGSMGSEATNANAESGGLSVLDIVKHALRTILNNLDDSDRLSLVCFSTKAKVLFDLKRMDNIGKTQAEQAIEALDADGQTNLWDGLQTGLEVLRNGSTEKGKNAVVFLLTDGEPNIVPPRGHIPQLQKYKDDHKSLNCTINTFGFGYSLDSELLNGLAVEGNGMYSFIPDSSFVGTVFINSLTNVLTTAATNVSLTLEALNDGEILHKNNTLVGHQSLVTSKGATVNFGSINFGQNKDLAFKMVLPKDETKPYLRATLRYYKGGSEELHEIVAEGVNREDDKEIKIQLFRTEAVEAIIDSMKSLKDFLVKDLIARIKKSDVATTPFVEGLLKDLEGQVLEAFSKPEYYKKWGRHYLPSLYGAHLHQQCNNFKDPGVQNYGGVLFSQIRDKLDETFLKLPPPKPTLPKFDAKTSSYTYSSAPVNMSAYYSSHDPCFDGNCEVLMADGTLKAVRDLKKNDQVKTPTGLATIVCIIKTHCYSNRTRLVELPGGLKVTPWHPVRVNNKWRFPCDLAIPLEKRCPAVYSFVLDREHIMTINGIECITLGHGYNDEVIKHDYFGTDLIIKDLQKMKGWENGLIELNSGCLGRNLDTGLIDKIVQNRVEQTVS